MYKYENEVFAVSQQISAERELRHDHIDDVEDVIVLATEELIDTIREQLPDVTPEELNAVYEYLWGWLLSEFVERKREEKHRYNIFADSEVVDRLDDLQNWYHSTIAQNIAMI